MKSKAKRTIVIVGGVAGGASAATRARRCNEDAHIIMFEKDKHVSFANCGLPYYIGGEIDRREKLLVATPELFKNRFNLDVRIEQEVVEIDRSSKTVKVQAGKNEPLYEQAYDKLILATGASPIIPPIKGIDASNVFSLRTLEDTDRIESFLIEKKPQRAVVIGAGFIGLEMVEQLHALGIHVSLVELDQQILPPLDSEMADVIGAALVDRGVELHLGDGLEGFQTEGDLVTSVRLQSGTHLDAGLVILGIGVRPNTGLAERSGLQLGPMGGITVNEFMQTSDPEIYSVGDAVEYMHGVLNQPVRMPLAGPANRSGRVAGEHAARDAATPVAPVLGTAIIRVFNQTAAVTGLNVKHAQKHFREVRSVVVIGKHHAGYYPGGETLFLKLVYDPATAKVLGAQAVGGQGVDKRIDIIATAIRFGATVHELSGVDLAYAPPYGSAKDPVHMAAFAASNDIDGLSSFHQIGEDLEGKQVVDVRSKSELLEFSLPSVIHIPLEELRDRLVELKSEKSTVVVCGSGLRAHVAVRILLQHGFEDVKNLTGGVQMQRYARKEEKAKS